MAVRDVCLLLCLLVLGFGAESTFAFLGQDNHSNESQRIDYPKVDTPHTWICLTTSGGKSVNRKSSGALFFTPVIFSSAGLNTTGGNIDKHWCGESCDSKSDGVKDVLLGVFGALLAIVLFGSNFIPVKKYDTGDGEQTPRFELMSLDWS